MQLPWTPDFEVGGFNSSGVQLVLPVPGEYRLHAQVTLQPTSGSTPDSFQAYFSRPSGAALGGRVSAKRVPLAFVPVYSLDLNVTATFDLSDNENSIALVNTICFDTGHVCYGGSDTTYLSAKLVAAL
jgi:hypothetical protein